MKTDRWQRAKPQNVATPTPWIFKPTAYDLKLRIDHDKKIAYIGPIIKRDPQTPHLYANIAWQQGRPDAKLDHYDGLSVVSYKYTGGGSKRITIDYFDRNNKKLFSSEFNIYIGAATPATGSQPTLVVTG